MPDLRKSIFVASLILFIVYVFLFRDYSIDDAFITFRYAENLVDGHGLVFNPGDNPVEGYSNFLWLLLLSLIYLIGLPVYLSAKIMGVVSFLAAAFLWFRHFHEGKSRFEWLVGPFLLICPITAFWGLSGLELGLHTLLITVMAIGFLRKSPIVYFVLPLLILSRPEGIIIVPAAIAVVAVVDHFAGHLNKRFIIICLMMALVTAVALICFRLLVFGYPLPNTFYAKTHHSLYKGLLETGYMLLIFAPFAVAFLWSLIKAVKRKGIDKAIILFSCLFLLQAAVSSAIDPVMNFHFRYLIPFFPLLLVVSLKVVSQISSNSRRGIVLGLFVLSLAIPLPLVAETVDHERKVIESQDMFIGWVKDMPKSATFSITDIGRIPYYSGRNFIDIWGLVNEVTGQEGFSSTREFLRLPDYFVLVGYMAPNKMKLRFEREQAIANNDAFVNAYRLVAICLPDGVDPYQPGYYYLVLQIRPETIPLR